MARPERLPSCTAAPTAGLLSQTAIGEHLGTSTEEKSPAGGLDGKARKKERNRLRYLAKRDELRAKQKDYYAKNREARKAYQRGYHSDNREKCSEANRLWREANHETYNAYHRERWHEKVKPALAVRLQTIVAWYHSIPVGDRLTYVASLVEDAKSDSLLRRLLRSAPADYLLGDELEHIMNSTALAAVRGACPRMTPQR